MYLLLGKWLGSGKCGEEGQGVSEYALLVALIVLVVVTAVHLIGMDAQHVIDRVNDALQHFGD
jgi:Flp pilus assembly pilin Flp